MVQLLQLLARPDFTGQFREVERHPNDVGERGPEDKATAMKPYRRAWRLGSHSSASNIAIIYRAQGKNRTMFKWWQRVALAGDGSAKHEMAKCYLKGIGV